MASQPCNRLTPIYDTAAVTDRLAKPETVSFHPCNALTLPLISIFTLNATPIEIERKFQFEFIRSIKTATSFITHRLLQIIYSFICTGIYIIISTIKIVHRFFKTCDN